MHLNCWCTRAFCIDEFTDSVERFRRCCLFDRDEAEMEYLKIAQDLEMYGVNYFQIKVIIIISRVPIFTCCFFTVLTQYAAVMTTVVAVSTCHWRSTEHMVFAIVFGFFSTNTKFARPKWDANSWEKGMTVDTDGLRYLPRWASETAACSLRTAADRQI